MRYLSLKRAFFLLFTPLFCLSACQSPDTSASVPNRESDLHFPLPNEPDESDFPIQDVPAPPISEEIPIQTDEWDVSDVDISHINANRKLIAFTFDDAPARTIENIFAVFANFNEEYPDQKASATLFLNGGRFDAQTPHLLATACALGFELGNHTTSHFDLTTLNEEEIRNEINRTDALLQKADGKARHLLRAPFGRVNERVKACAYAPIINWTIDTLDWTGITADEIYERVFSRRFSGAIVLMHDGYTPTVSALKRLLPDLAADGYQVVSVSQLIKAHGCTFKRGGEYIRALKRQKNI